MVVTDQIDSDNTQLKARAALRWCGYANQQTHSEQQPTKSWYYLLIPHDVIALGQSLERLKAMFDLK